MYENNLGQSGYGVDANAGLGFNDPSDLQKYDPFLGKSNNNGMLPSSNDVEIINPSLSEREKVINATNIAFDYLRIFANRSDRETIMNTAFGLDFDKGKATGILNQFRAGDFSNTPKIDIVTGLPINTNGAFDVVNNKIYLAKEFVDNHSEREIAGVIGEEKGHGIDALINIKDAPGDEGDIFSRLVRGESISGEELSALKAEDDHRIIMINGQETLIEMSSLPILPTITIVANDNNAGEVLAGQTQNPGQFTLTRTGNLFAPLTVNYSVSGTATNGTDYSNLPGTVTFAPNSNTAIINLNVIDDANFEGSETAIITLRASSFNSYGLGTNTIATVNLADNDLPTINITANDNSAGETLTGQTQNPGQFTLTRTGNLTSPLTVNYSVSGTATNGTDYTNLPGTVTFAANSNTALINLNVIDDGIYEGSENVILTLNNSVNYAVGTAKNATLNITDNEIIPVITIVANDNNASEVLAGQTQNPGQFTLTRTGNLTSPLTVNYSVSGTATNGTDYTNLPGNVTFAANSNTAIINLNVIDDANFEGSENVVLTLINNANYSVGTANNATVTITDNDIIPVITIVANDNNAGEVLTGQTQNPGQFTLTRTGNLTNPLTVNYAVSGTATNGTDYSSLPGSVTFAANSNTALINLNVIDDANFEGSENVNIVLNASNLYGLGSNTTATVNIADNEIIPVITIVANDNNAGEVLAGQTQNPGQFTLTRTGNLTNPLTVNYSVSGTATNGTDYTNLPGTVTFAANSNTAIINLNVIDDGIYEGNETAIISLSASNSYGLGTNTTATVNIADNEIIPTINISANDNNAGEVLAGQTQNPGQFTLTRTGNLTSALTVNYSVSGTATNGTDYSNLPGSVTFAANSNTALINLNVTDDANFEGSENVNIILNNSANYAIGTANNATVTITDNDLAPFITVTSPNGGNTLQRGQTYAINWNGNIATAENVRIDLYKKHPTTGQDVFWQRIVASTPNTGSYQWTVTSDNPINPNSGTNSQFYIPIGSDYKIKVTSLNNTSLNDYSDSYITITGNPTYDLLGSSFSAIGTNGSNTVTAGGTVNTSFSIRNNGSDVAGAFKVGFYLSTDANFTTSDYLLGDYTINSLNPQTSTDAIISTLTLPGAGNSFWQGDKTYYIGAIVDYKNAIAEVNESNNSVTALYSGFNSLTVTNTNNNQAPEDLRFSLSNTTYKQGETVSIQDGWLYDANGTNDISKVDIWLKKDGNTTQYVGSINSFTSSAQDNRWANLSNVQLNNLNLSEGSYQLNAVAYDSSGVQSNWFSKGFEVISQFFVPTEAKSLIQQTFSNELSLKSPVGSLVGNIQAFGKNGWIQYLTGAKDPTKPETSRGAIIYENGRKEGVAVYDNILDLYDQMGVDKLGYPMSRPMPSNPISGWDIPFTSGYALHVTGWGNPSTLIAPRADGFIGISGAWAGDVGNGAPLMQREAILNRYGSQGVAALGSPMGKASSLPGGYVQKFANGSAIFAPLGSNKSYFIGEGIWRAYESEGGVYSRKLGFAISDEESYGSGVRVRFENGSIEWTAQSGSRVNYATDDNPSTAREIIVETQSPSNGTIVTKQDWVGSSDPNDYYRFYIGSSKADFMLSLDKTNDTVWVDLFNDKDRNGQLDSNELVESLVSSVYSPKLMTRMIEEGIYYIKVNHPFSGGTNYKINLSATSIINPFNSTYGYGLVNAAAAVARAIGQQTFADVANLGGNNWANDLINAPEVWAKGYTGQGVTVAVIDSGVDINHIDLGANIWRNPLEIAGNGIDDDGNGYIDDINGWNFGVGQNNNNIMPGTDFNNHGTHVAGTIAALKNDWGIQGVAYNAKIMPIRLGDVNNNGTFTNPGSLDMAIRYAVDNGAKVINMSISSSDNVGAALQYAASKGVITITAAGNDKSSFPGNPANLATWWGIAVGAVDNNKNIADFSNKAGSDNRMQYVVAPGKGIFSTLPNNSDAIWQGTSMAAPHVTGIVALMLSANPYLTVEQIRYILTATATRLS